MKKLLFSLLLISSLSNAQALFDKGVKITGGITTDNTAPNVVVKSSNNVLNTISKTELQDAFYFATASALPVVGITDKLYITRDDNKLYRFNGTIYVPLNAGITSTATTNFIPKVNAGGNLVSSTISEDANGVLIQGNYVGANIAPLIVNNITPYGSPFTQFVQLWRGAGSTIMSLRADGALSANNSVSGSSLISTGSGNTSVPAIRLGTINGTGLFLPVTNAIGFTSGGTEAGRIHASRRWSINSTTDDGINQLQVNGTVKASPAVTSDQLATLGQVNSSAILLTGNQSATGRKSFISDDTTVGGISITNNRMSTTGNYGNNAGLYIGGNGGAGILTDVSSDFGARVINSKNGSVGVFSAINAANGFAFCAQNEGGAAGFYTRVDGTSTGLAFAAGNGSSNVFQVDRLGVVTLVGGTALNNAVPRSQLLYNSQTITANKTVTIAEFANNNELILSVNATSGNITITLPTFNDLRGYKVTVKKMDSSANSVLIQGVGGINIDGSATLIISGQYGTATIGANLSQYIINSDESNIVKNIVKEAVQGANVTGTVSETILYSKLIPANTFKDGDFMTLFSRVVKSGTAGTLAQRVKINTSNTLTGAILIASNNFTVNHQLSSISRIFSINNNFLVGLNTGPSTNDEIATTNPPQSYIFNPTVDNYIFVTGQLANSADTMYHLGTKITN